MSREICLIVFLIANGLFSAGSADDNKNQIGSDTVVLSWERIGSIPKTLIAHPRLERIRSGVYDTRTDTLIFFDGSKTYTWSGRGTWKDWGLSEVAKVYYDPDLEDFFPVPNGRRGQTRLIRHPLTGEILLFGSELVDPNQTGIFRDIWSWDGAKWEFSGANSYTRLLVNYTVDETSGNGVFYGGHRFDLPSDQEPLTWIFDGQNITPVDSASPPWRFLTSMAYDPLRKRIVLYGGFEKQRYDPPWNGEWHAITGTWEWDGTKWTRIRLGGPRVGGHTVTFDPRLGACILTGGVSTTAYKQKDKPPLVVTKYNKHVYAWTGGKRWEKLEVKNPLPPRYGHLAVYAEELGGLIIFGGTDKVTTMNGLIAGSKDYQGIYRLKVKKVRMLTNPLSEDATHN